MRFFFMPATLTSITYVDYGILKASAPGANAKAPILLSTSTTLL
jgi:hypothetical protein